MICACGCPRDVHEHYTCTDYCGRCGCPHWRPARLSWYQFWRPRMTVPDSPAGLTAIPIRRES